MSPSAMLLIILCTCLYIGLSSPKTIAVLCNALDGHSYVGLQLHNAYTPSTTSAHVSKCLTRWINKCYVRTRADNMRVRHVCPPPNCSLKAFRHQRREASRSVCEMWMQLSLIPTRKMRKTTRFHLQLVYCNISFSACDKLLIEFSENLWDTKLMEFDTEAKYGKNRNWGSWRVLVMFCWEIDEDDKVTEIDHIQTSACTIAQT